MKTDISKVFLWGMVCSLLLSGLLGIIIFIFASFHEREVKVLLSTLDVGACSLAGLCCSTILSSRYRWFSIVGITTSALCMCIMLFTIWHYEHIDNYDVLLTLVVLSATCAHISLILLTKTSTAATSYILAATVMFIAMVGVMLLKLIWQNDPPELFYRLLGVFGILDVLGTIITPVLGKAQTYEDVIES